MKAAFGIVVIARDEETRLGRCLQSLEGSGADPVVVVVDSRTRDDTAAVARAYTKHVIVADGQRGRLRNIGYRHVNQPFVGFLDADMLATTDYFRYLAQFLDQRPGVAAIAGRQFARQACLFSRLECQYWNYRRAVGTGGAMFRVAALDEVGGFRDELNVGEDADVLHRLRQRGWDIAWTPAVAVQHEHAPDIRAWYHKMTHGSSAGLHWRAWVRAGSSPMVGLHAALTTGCLHLAWYVPVRAVVMLRKQHKEYQPLGAHRDPLRGNCGG
ncbi:glycosyltransferase [Caldinitratiruptor microaerophilus]|uniref:glycosyltransferase n=1 Tax=Caldinitratiruptor microaerophilus TaxID=671077 RepID=UPI003872F88F